jgi:hypothetical protein
MRDVGERSDRAEAQRRVHRIRAFRAELDAVREAGVGALSDEQRQDIDRYHDALLEQLAREHDVDRTEAAGQLSRGMQIAALFAAIALTGAVYSLVARFWGRLDLPVQATLLGAFPLMALVAVELSAERERTLYIASIFAFVAFGSYWVAVFVLSDRMNVPLTPVAIWGGALFGVALAVAYGFRLMFGGALIALLVALAGSVFQAAGSPWTLVPEFPEVVTAAAFLLTASASRLAAADRSFPAITRGVGFGVGLLGLLLLSAAAPASLLPTTSRVTVAIYQVLTLLVATLVLAAGVRNQWHETVYVAASALTVFIVSRFVDWFWEAMPRFVFFLLLAAIALAWLLVLRRLRARLGARERR